MKKIVLAFLFLFVGIVANAQEDFSDDTIDVPAAAIDNYVHWVFILSIIISNSVIISSFDLDPPYLQ